MLKDVVSDVWKGGGWFGFALLALYAICTAWNIVQGQYLLAMAFACAFAGWFLAYLWTGTAATWRDIAYKWKQIAEWR